MPYDDKPYPATFGQVSSKSDMAKMLIFGPFLTLIPYNPDIKIFFKNPLGTFFHSHQDTTLCKVSEKSDVRFPRYGVTHAHTHARTHTHTRTHGQP